MNNEARETNPDPEVFEAPASAIRFNAQSGRRALRAELEATHRILAEEPYDMIRHAHLAPRAVRRASAKKNGTEFKPVLGHAIPAPNHYGVMVALRTKDKTTKLAWYRKQKANADADAARKAAL